MDTYIRVIFVVVLGALLIGCQSGRPITMEPEAPVLDFSAPFIFAESSFLNINSDLMAEQFHIDRLPAAYTSIDSTTAVNAVYQLLMDSLLGEDSKSFDLSTVPHLYRQYMQLRFEETMRVMYADLMVGSVVVNDSIVRAEYDLNKEEFLLPTLYRARHIVISGHGLKKSADSVLYVDLSEDELDSIAYAKTSELHARAVSGASFDTLAIMYSLDPGSAKKGGDLGYFQLSSLVSPFDSTVEHTPVGEISGIIKTIFGWHFIKVEDYSPEHYQSIDSVWSQLELKAQQKLLMEHSTRFVDSLKKVRTIELDTAAIMMADSLHGNEDPLAYLNREDTLYGNDTLYFRRYSEQLYSFKKMGRIEGELDFEQKVFLIKSIVIRYDLLRASRTLGYYNNPDMEEWSANLIKKYSVATLRKRMLNDNYHPIDEEIKAYYDENIDQYKVERPIYVQHIIFADSNLAEHVRDLINSGTDFMDAAREYYPGDPDIREAAADLGHIGPRDMPREFWQAIQRTPVGELSTPVKTEFGYHIINVVEKKYSISLEKSKTKIVPILKKLHKNAIRRDYVHARLDSLPIIHWELLGDLYRKVLPPPTSLIAGPR